MPPGKASKPLTDHLITGKPLKSEHAQEKWFSQTIHTYINHIGLQGDYTCIYEAHFECHDILMLGKSPIKWRQRPDMTIAVDWDVKHQFNQTNFEMALHSFQTQGIRFSKHILNIGMHLIFLFFFFFFFFFFCF